MTHPTQSNRDDASTPPDRETVARVIEPGCLDEASIVKYGGYGRSQRALAKADAIIALWPTGEGVSGGVAPDGYVLVPREATMPMLVAATSRDQGPDDSLYASIYRAMVQAALRGRGEGGAGEGQGAAGQPSGGGEG